MANEQERESFWQVHVATWRGSGETQRAYCLRHGLKCHSLSYWHQRQIHREGSPAARPLTLVPASILPEAALTPMGPLSLITPNGWRLEFVALPSTTWLNELWCKQP